MKLPMAVVLLLCLIAFTQLGMLEAQNALRCNTYCLANNVKCLNSRTYKVCMNDDVVFDDVQTCPLGTYCSDGAEVCVSADTPAVDFVCGTESSGSGSCDECEPGDVFTCVDRTHFTMCQNRDAYISCGAGKVCVKELLKISELICISPLVATQLHVPPSCLSTTTTISTTTAAPTTPNMNDAIIACLSANKPNTSPSFYLIPNILDSTCRTYIYCERNGNGGIQAAPMHCTSGKFYDNAKAGCVNKFVTNCDSTLTTTTTTTPATTTSGPTSMAGLRFVTGIATSPHP